jgi:hypothetical protein
MRPGLFIVYRNRSEWHLNLQNNFVQLGDDSAIRGGGDVDGARAVRIVDLVS